MTSPIANSAHTGTGAPLAFDAVLIAGFGGPESMDEVPAFLQRVSGGHIPPDRLAEVEHHYARFNGVSPVNGQHRELAAALKAALAARGINVPVDNGNRHTPPHFDQALAQLAAGGARRVLAVVPTPYSSYSGCRAYREELFAGLPRDASGHATLEVFKLDPYWDLPALVSAQVELLQPALAAQPGAHIVFTTHSIPTEMARTSGPVGGAYVRQHLELIDAVMIELARRGIHATWELAYQSRSGSPRTPWLEPDINDVVVRCAGEGVRSIICSPIGFLTDHMEVVWDLDTEARQTAVEHEVHFVRVPTVGTVPVFIEGLADHVAKALRAGNDSSLAQAKPAPSAVERQWCTEHCCPNARGAKPSVPGISVDGR